MHDPLLASKLARGFAAAMRADERVTFREFLTSPRFCGVTDASPMILAIVDASEGRPVTTIDDKASTRYFGCARSTLPTAARRTVVVQAGGRGGKTSRLLATKALHAAWTVPLPNVAPGEHAVSLIVSSEVVFAKQALSFCRGYTEHSPVLSAALVGDPGQESLTLRRPDGNLVDVRVRAAGQRGKGGRAFTLVSAFMDEACFFYDETGAVNDVEIYRAAAQRIVEGGQLWLVSTPWIEGEGKLEELLRDNIGTHADALAVRHVGTRVLNPSWDPSGDIERDLRKDPDNAAREIDAIPLSGASARWFAGAAIDTSVNHDRPLEVPRESGWTYAAGGDTGFRRNSSTLAIAGLRGGKVKIALLRELRPERGVPLKPAGVVAAFARDMSAYGCGSLTVDAHEREAVELELVRHGMSAEPAPAGQIGKAEAFVLTRKLMHEGNLELPDDPRFVRQLRDVVGKPMPGGGTSIQSPVRRDGSHGDLVSAAVNAVWAVFASDRKARDTAGYTEIPEYYD